MYQVMCTEYYVVLRVVVLVQYSMANECMYQHAEVLEEAGITTTLLYVHGTTTT